MIINIIGILVLLALIISSVYGLFKIASYYINLIVLTIFGWNLFIYFFTGALSLYSFSLIHILIYLSWITHVLLKDHGLHIQLLPLHYVNL